MPINNFILVTEPLGEDRANEIIRGGFCVHDTRFVVNYYRMTPDHRLLFGGGENYRRSFPGDIKRFVRRYMLQIFPQLDDAAIDYAWGGTLAITMNRLPHFGHLEPNLWFAQGYSGHGLTLTTLAGKLIAEAVDGMPDRFDAFRRMAPPRFPGGTLLRWPGMVAGMLYYSLRDRLL
jgi:gamma-glutamylputrescine oxidase